MNEKRFELAYEQDNWWAVRDGDITLWKEEVVDKMNEQQTTIQEQDKRIKELERMLKKCDAERIRLQNERGAIVKFGVRGGSV